MNTNLKLLVGGRPDRGLNHYLLIDAFNAKPEDEQISFVNEICDVLVQNRIFEEKILQISESIFTFLEIPYNKNNGNIEVEAMSEYPGIKLHDTYFININPEKLVEVFTSDVNKALSGELGDKMFEAIEKAKRHEDVMKNLQALGYTEKQAIELKGIADRTNMDGISVTGTPVKKANLSNVAQDFVINTNFGKGSKVDVMGDIHGIKLDNPQFINSILQHLSDMNSKEDAVINPLMGPPPGQGMTDSYKAAAKDLEKILGLEFVEPSTIREKFNPIDKKDKNTPK